MCMLIQLLIIASALLALSLSVLFCGLHDKVFLLIFAGSGGLIGAILFWMGVGIEFYRAGILSTR